MSACALLAYPRSMPGAREMRRQAIREGTLRPEDSRIQGKLSDIIPATLTLFKNMTFVFNTLALTATMVISTGLGPFVVKYLQAQFGVSTMKAGIASGIALIPGEEETFCVIGTHDNDYNKKSRQDQVKIFLIMLN